VEQSVKNTPRAEPAIEQPRVHEIGLEIVGTAPMIQNNFSQKAIEQMLRKHMGLAVTREAKKPRECIEAATIRNMKDEVCVPPTALKKAMLTASTATKTLKKTQLRTSLYVVGQSLPLKFSDMVPRMDMVRTSGMSRTPDVRFRPSFNNWSVRVLIQYSDQLMPQTVVDLVQRAGAVGLGEWRPEKDGVYGTFKVSRMLTDRKELAEVRQACETSLVPLVIPEWAMDVEISPDLMAKIARQNQDEEAEEEVA
jgi:hypothetical protein